MAKLNDNLIEIYSLVIAIYSMYAIYFSCIQFVIQLKSKNIFFGINYVSEKIDKLKVIKFSRTKYFFLLLLLLGVLPIFFTWNIIIECVWMIILVILIILFLIILYKVFNLIFEISDDDILGKQKFCFKEYIKNIDDKIKKIFEKYENENDIPDKDKSTVMAREIWYNIANYVNPIEKIEEKNYLYNVILKKLSVTSKVKDESFYIWFFKDFLENNYKLIYCEYYKRGKDNGNNENIDFRYPLLDSFAELNKSNECFEIILKILENSKNLESALVISFAFKIIDKYSFEQVKDVLNIIDVFEDFNILKISCSELVYQLLLCGDKSENNDINELKRENIKKIWQNLFEISSNLLELNYPEFFNTSLKVKTFNITDNIYMEAKNNFLKDNKKIN